ncbi:ATP-dependent DNA helicase RecG [Pseudomonas flavescens]|uniref:ATP-dependent DNA helicase RecG n=1 Tax=Phytopseudomonas flavescens TaxID=29435 RepID=A0A1G8NPP9_9GAMM|nr:helix-turn-helix domain-containing protein [Pseudomonas flavescens]SDI82122.1 ATP-dependent DNA helicase RecG [Pseudomonas flavescens]
MMQPIEQLLQQAENKQLEFKRDLSSPKPLLKALVAFANTAGGQRIIGVADNGDIVGVDDPLAEEERLGSLIADSIAPRLLPNIELLTVEGKTLLRVEVFLSSSRPRYLKALGPEHGVLVRQGSSNRQADVRLIAELGRLAAGETFDAMPMPELSLDDLDLPAMQQQFGASVALDEQKLLTLKLLTRYQGRLVPTKGAVLLFGKHRQLHFDDAWIQCGRFRGTDKVDIFDQSEIHDYLPQAVDSIELFLKKHAFKSAEFTAMRRTDVWSIPLTMLREAVINALVHSDYSQRGSPIRIAFFDDRIEIESPGMLLPGMTVEDMKNGVSMIRNPVIARVFRELKLIEQWGSGVKRIFAEAVALGLPEPQIQEIANRVRFIIALAAPVSVTPSQADSLTRSQQESRLESRLESKLAARVVMLLRHQPLGKAALAEQLGHKSVSGELHKQIKRLLELAVIEMTLPDKPNSHLQKYRLLDASLTKDDA